MKLKEGENIIEVKANDNGQELSDKIIWYYSPENKKSASSEQPKERTEEHIGL